MIESMAWHPGRRARRGAVPEVIEHGRSGIIVDEYRLMPAVIEEADALDPLECRRYVEERFTAERMVNDYGDVPSRDRAAPSNQRVTLTAALRRSPHDWEIMRLAVLALGALAAQPLFTLTDTAIVGHLGTSQLAALGIAGVVLGGVFAIFNFLAYGTTSQVSRAAGAGARETADRLGAQAFWLSFAIGCVAAALALAAESVVALMGGEGQTAEYAVTYLRIAVIGPFAFLVLGGQGYFRGVADLRTPLAIEVVANAVNVVLVVLFVYGFGWGIAGSAAGLRSRRAAWASPFWCACSG